MLQQETGEGGEIPSPRGGRRRRSRRLDSSETYCCTLCRLCARVVLCRRTVCCQHTQAEEELSNAATRALSGMWQLGEEPFCSVEAISGSSGESSLRLKKTHFFFRIRATCSLQFKASLFGEASSICTHTPRPPPDEVCGPLCRCRSPSPTLPSTNNTISSAVLVCVLFFLFSSEYTPSLHPRPLCRSAAWPAHRRRTPPAAAARLAGGRRPLCPSGKPAPAPPWARLCGCGFSIGPRTTFPTCWYVDKGSGRVACGGGGRG